MGVVVVEPGDQAIDLGDIQDASYGSPLAHFDLKTSKFLGTSRSEKRVFLNKRTLAWEQFTTTNGEQLKMGFPPWKQSFTIHSPPCPASKEAFQGMGQHPGDQALEKQRIMTRHPKSRLSYIEHGWVCFHKRESPRERTETGAKRSKGYRRVMTGTGKKWPSRSNRTPRKNLSILF